MYPQLSINTIWLGCETGNLLFTVSFYTYLCKLGGWINLGLVRLISYCIIFNKLSHTWSSQILQMGMTQHKQSLWATKKLWTIPVHSIKVGASAALSLWIDCSCTHKQRSWMYYHDGCRECFTIDTLPNTLHVAHPDIKWDKYNAMWWQCVGSKHTKYGWLNYQILGGGHHNNITKQINSVHLTVKS
jgi:hypothetical protein